MTVQTLAILVLLVSFFVMIFLRFPIAYAVGLSSVFCLMVQGQALTDVCRLMVQGISSFSLMAVPFFITMGGLMGSGGISEKKHIAVFPVKGVLNKGAEAFTDAFRLISSGHAVPHGEIPVSRNGIIRKLPYIFYLTAVLCVYGT